MISKIIRVAFFWTASVFTIGCLVGAWLVHRQP